jgi:hypothetical protein
MNFFLNNSVSTERRSEPTTSPPRLAFFREKAGMPTAYFQ